MSRKHWRDQHPGETRCDVILQPDKLALDCVGVAVATFTATCPRRHEITGNACQDCVDTPASKLGCLRCYDDGRGIVRLDVKFAHYATL